MIYSIYILLDDGRCIFNHALVTNPPPYLLVSGLLSAMQDFVYEVSNSYVERFTAGGYTFYCEKRGPIMVVISTSSLDEDRVGDEFNLLQIALRFMSKYGHLIDEWQGDLSVFNGFAEDLKEILGEERLVKRDKTPSNPLTSMTLVSLDKELQTVAQAMVQLGKADIDKVVQLTGLTPYKVERDLESLVAEGHLGRFTMDDKEIYFTQ